MIYDDYKKSWIEHHPNMSAAFEKNCIEAMILDDYQELKRTIESKTTDGPILLRLGVVFGLAVTFLFVLYKTLTP